MWPQHLYSLPSLERILGSKHLHITFDVDIYTSFASLYSFIYLKLWASNIDDSFRILLPVQMSQVIEQHLCLTLCRQLKQL